MNITIASSEVVPFAKTGGLADVCGALPQQLAKLGHTVSVFLPGYRGVIFGDFELEDTGHKLEIPINGEVVLGGLLKTKLPHSDVTLYVIQHDDYFDREGLYGEHGHEYEDNCERFVFFSRGVLESIRLLDLQTDLIHVHDWQTGLIPALLKIEYASNPIYERIASLLTIHNLEHQGIFDRESMSLTGLDWSHFHHSQMEYYGQLNLLKTGLVFSDSINTVSPTYAQEIQTPDQGHGLDGVLVDRRNSLSGILNGIDGTVWNPATDKLIAANYTVEDWAAGKAKCKSHLQDLFDLELDPNKPIIGIVARLAPQKGWSMIIQVMRQWLETMDVQWVVLGTGDPNYHAVLTSLYQLHPQRLGLRLGFSNELAHQIEAGSDLFLMPSRYEPCGLNQMYSMAYGTVPVARNTGGLSDTIVDADADFEPVISTVADSAPQRPANGFLFDDFNDGSMERALRRAVTMYSYDKEGWQRLVTAGMEHDWSWAASAKVYEQLYQETVARFRGRLAAQ